MTRESMRYLGGKSRVAPKIAAYLESVRPPGAPFYDVFCGGLSITAAMSGERVANDACEPLINLYRAWLAGWRPPASVSEQEYQAIKAKRDPADPMTAFAGFGLSYGGKWFGGYAGGVAKQGNGRYYDYNKQNQDSLARKLHKCVNVRFTCVDFDGLHIPDGALVYLDAPYRGTTGYGFFEAFDHDRFDLWALTLARRCKVVRSEFALDAPWCEVWQRLPGRQLTTNIDRLYTVDP